ncbi:MAG TPA: flagellar motor protein MotB [Terracidiphilus sp.]|jgi:chemotaxis protein MotB|nr:flagellar motor protein MotB [Terracidiphilus sp.]
MAAKAQPIIVIKKKGGHGGHHGGAWKVAYADFVTAMMALFIVLWLMSSSTKVKEAVAGYFNDPKGTATLLGTTLSGAAAETIPEVTSLQRLKERLEAEINAKKELQKLSKQIEITITPEGLRIELIEGRNGTFYESGSAQLSHNGQELLALLAGELKTLPNSLLIEGHTDAAKYTTNTNYGNWELSADRANSARRLLQADGVRDDQVTQVRGYADQMLRVKNNPYDPSNRRISIIVKNMTGAPPPLQLAAAKAVGATGAPAPASGLKPESKSKSAAAPASTAETASATAPAAHPAGAAFSRANLMSKIAGLLPHRK